MLTILSETEKLLPSLLMKPDVWTGLYVDYHHPYVERLWTQLGENRISLHKIYPCKVGEALFHPHPWPQAVKILKGEYEMGVGYGENHQKSPPIASTLMLKADTTYEMTDPDGWHYVRPLTEPSYSIMVTGKPWQEKNKSEEKLRLRTLTRSEKEDLLNTFKEFYNLE
ncbi:MAG: hypothetical protein ABI425_03835 [Patescibacteria group bacterium]